MPRPRFTQSQLDLIAMANDDRPVVTKADAQHVIEWLEDATPELVEEATWNSETPAQMRFAERAKRLSIASTIRKLKQAKPYLE